MTQSDTTGSDFEERVGYDVHAVQEKWLPVWDDIAPFRSGRPDDERPTKYILDMFPYPSGDLHMGHAEAYAMGDVIARYWAQQGFNVLHPIGWDSFGLPAENAAIKNGLDPADWTNDNIAQQKASMRRYACSFDWDRVLQTSDPVYYRWNQWLFLRMFEKGLAYRKDSAVNWCPNDQTVLANEQVVAGRCERCDTVVTKKKLTQWYLRITDYADRLLDDMSQLEGQWPEKVLLMQRNWIGRSTGADVSFVIEGRAEPVHVYTTRPDTLFGATFFVVAADSDLAAELAAGTSAEADFAAYLDGIKQVSDIDRMASDRPKTGVFLQRYASRSTRLTTSWPTTAPARSWRCRRTTSATGSSPGPSVCPSSRSCSLLLISMPALPLTQARALRSTPASSTVWARPRRSSGQWSGSPSMTWAPDRSTTACATG